MTQIKSQNRSTKHMSNKHEFKMSDNALTPEQESEMDEIAQILVENLRKNTLKE